MTTQQISRLIVAIAAVVLISILLFTGSKTSAAKGDRSAPTTPTNLVVTGLTDSTVSLSWQGSTDNSGSLSYRIKITNLANSAYNSLATVSQTQTTYTARYLATNSSYTFSVYAIDGSGNKSADSNLVGAKTLADTTPPSTPVLQVAVLSPSEVQLTWSRSTDNTNYCCNYSFNMNSDPLTQNIYWAQAPANSLSIVVRHLTPGTTNSFSVNVSDGSAGNVATSNTVSATMPPSSDGVPPSAPTNIHLVQDNSCGEIFLGWTESADNADSQDNIEYEIYVNGVLSPLPISAGIDYDFVYATAFGDNVFTVKAVDRSGNTSTASSPLKLFLWPC
jgi:fibronectin type 3 domain-containing protein